MHLCYEHAETFAGERVQAEAQEPGLAQTCFSIFEGGGAKGITHLGALKALEEVGLTSLGTAGASAGAIIAALKAVGYSADELFTSGVDNILAKRGLTPVDLLGRRDWTSFVRLKRRPVAGAFARVPSTLRFHGLQVLSIIVPPLLPLIAFTSRVRQGARGCSLLYGASSTTSASSRRSLRATSSTISCDRSWECLLIRLSASVTSTRCYARPAAA